MDAFLILRGKTGERRIRIISTENPKDVIYGEK
jgi:hypothetical protein